MNHGACLSPIHHVRLARADFSDAAPKFDSPLIFDFLGGREALEDLTEQLPTLALRESENLRKKSAKVLGHDA